MRIALEMAMESNVKPQGSKNKAFNQVQLLSENEDNVTYGIC